MSDVQFDDGKTDWDIHISREQDLANPSFLKWIRSGDMCRSPHLTQEFLLLLESHYEEILRLADEHAEDVRKVLRDASSLILSRKSENTEETLG